ncbi:MAG TPA: hypothetical protein VGN57_21760 [Pirellulaceae bacterium]|jgi:hypothetical protein|nr:hypothetical protein [Pirellulaceae bacterium]
MIEQAMGDRAGRTLPAASGPGFAFATPPRPRARSFRRFLRFNLLTALILFLLVSAYCGMRQRFVVPRTEIAASKTLSDIGARITTKPGGPEWLRQALLIPESRYQVADEVSFDPQIEGFYCQVGEIPTETDPRLEAIGDLTRLRSLDLWMSAFDDDALRYASRCTSLQRLKWNFAAVTDAGVERLRTLRDLRSIDLSSSFVSDRSLEALAHLPELNSIVLDESTTERGIAALLRYPKLREVDATRTSLRETDIRALMERGIAVRLPIPTAHPVVVPAKLDVAYPGFTTDPSGVTWAYPVTVKIPPNLKLGEKPLTEIDLRYPAIVCEFVGPRPSAEALSKILEDPRVVSVELPICGFPFRQEELRQLARNRPANAPYCRVHGNVLISGEALLKEPQDIGGYSSYCVYDVDSELTRKLEDAGILLFRDIAILDGFDTLRTFRVAPVTEPDA